MKSTGARMGALTAVIFFALPGVAFAADGVVEVVPYWLSVVVGAVGLVTAVFLLVDAVLLRRVSDGSIIAENIAYMMTSAVCFGFSMLLRWVVIFSEDSALAAQAALGADLLVTAGMALLAVYVYRVRRAMTGYLRAVSNGSSDQEADGGATE